MAAVLFLLTLVAFVNGDAEPYVEMAGEFFAKDGVASFITAFQTEMASKIQNFKFLSFREEADLKAKAFMKGLEAPDPKKRSFIDIVEAANILKAPQWQKFDKKCYVMFSVGTLDSSAFAIKDGKDEPILLGTKFENSGVKIPHGRNFANELVEKLKQELNRIFTGAACGDFIYIFIYNAPGYGLPTEGPFFLNLATAKKSDFVEPTKPVSAGKFGYELAKAVQKYIKKSKYVVVVKKRAKPKVEAEVIKAMEKGTVTVEIAGNSIVTKMNDGKEVKVDKKTEGFKSINKQVVDYLQPFKLTKRLSGGKKFIKTPSNAARDKLKTDAVALAKYVIDKVPAEVLSTVTTAFATGHLRGLAVQINAPSAVKGGRQIPGEEAAAGSGIVQSAAVVDEDYYDEGYYELDVDQEDGAERYYEMEGEDADEEFDAHDMEMFRRGYLKGYVDSAKQMKQKWKTYANAGERLRNYYNYD